MNHYIELTLIPNAEVSPYFIWSKLYTQLHLALVEIKDANDQVPVGVSFPGYRLSTKGGKTPGVLGTKLRLFAPTEQHFQQLDLPRWLARLADYVHTTSIRPVPTEAVTGYITVSRSRARPSKENLARRYAKRKGISLDEALTRLESYDQHANDKGLPYIRMQSLSNRQSNEYHPFNLLIQQQPAAQENSGLFSCYGLSTTSTVPSF